MTDARRQAVLPAVLIFTIAVTAVISSLGAPLLPSIATHLRVPLSTAQWSLTVTLLVGCILSPIMGRLGDGRRRRETMIVGLAVVTAGGVIAALATDLAVLVLGRGLQGVGLGLVPLAMAAARDHLPPERAKATIAVLSVTAAAGIGIGYPLSGLIADSMGLSAAFWFGAIVSGLALVCAAVVLPASAGQPTTIDFVGMALIASGLCALLLAIADGTDWGWGSTAVLSLLVAAAVILSIWVFHQLHAAAPVVQLRLLRHPAVLTSNVCTIVVGVAMYMYMSSVTDFLQTPHAAGYGFAASVVVAGLSLVPLSLTSLVTSRSLPWITARIGTRAIVPLGCLMVALGGGFFLVFHTALWQGFVMLGIIGIGIGGTSAVIPGIIIRSIPESETGSAMGFYQVVRYLGFSLGSALTASILASRTASGERLPVESGYTIVLAIAAGVSVVAAVLAWALPGERIVRKADAEVLVEDGELGPVGAVVPT
jgi:MFS family permease